jgi:hypothetical protein
VWVAMALIDANLGYILGPFSMLTDSVGSLEVFDFWSFPLMFL